MTATPTEKTYIVRPFEGTDEQYQIINDIFNACFPDYAHPVSMMKHEDATRSKKFPFKRELIEQDGKVIAYGEYRQDEWAYHPQKFGWRVCNYPDYDIHPLSEMYQARVIEQLKDKNLIGLTASAREDQPNRLDFLKAHDYQFKMRYPESHVDMSVFDASRFTEKVQRVTDSGIEIITAKQLSEEKPDEWHSILHELSWLIMQDIPLPDPPQKKSLEEYIEASFGHPAFLPDSYFIARDGDAYVGTSTLWKDAGKPERLWTGLTGVTRSHRRRGIATAIKVTALSHAKQLGIKFVQTDNEENNPMFQLNLELGFTPLPAWIDFEKAL